MQNNFHARLLVKAYILGRRCVCLKTGLPKDLLKGKGSMTNKTLHDLSSLCTGVLILNFSNPFVQKFGRFVIVLSSLFLLKIRFNNHYHRLNKTFEFIITYEYRYSIFWCLSSLVVSMVLILGELIYPCNGGKAFMKLYLNLITSKILAEIF